MIERHVDMWRGRERLGRGPLAALRVMAAEARLLAPQRSSFDVVVVGYPGHFDMRRARRVADRRPLVFMPHVLLADELIAEYGRYRPGSMAARLLETVDRRGLRLADLVVADSDTAGDLLAERAGIYRERVVTIYAGAEERIFSETWSPVRPFGALLSARLLPAAGLDVVLGAARALPELAIRVVGSGPLASLLDSPPPNVDWTAALPPDDLGIAFAHAGIALGVLGNTPSARTALPPRIFGALATGTPLVTGATPAAHELLEDGVNALLVPPGDVEALADALGRLTNDEALRRRLSEDGRELYARRASERVLGARWREHLGTTP